MLICRLFPTIAVSMHEALISLFRDCFTTKGIEHIKHNYSGILSYLLSSSDRMKSNKYFIFFIRELPGGEYFK